MKMFFDTIEERELAVANNIVNTSDFFFASGKVSVDWIKVKSGFEIQLLYLIFSSP